MSTKPRIIAQDVFYQITSKAVDNRPIFADTEMKEFFLRQLRINLHLFGYLCCGWSLMEDHYHIVLRSSDAAVSRFMQRFNSVIAKKYNRLHHREGVVFYRRFASIIVQEEAGLAQLVRYVHLNPVRSGECTLQELECYRWCGHRELFGKENTYDVIDKKTVWGLFDTSDPTGAYRSFVTSSRLDCQDDAVVAKVRAANRGRQDTGNPECWIVGDLDFIRNTLEKDRCRRVRIARYVTEEMTLGKLHDIVTGCIILDERESFFRQGRLNEISTARRLFVRLGVMRFDFSCADLAQYLKVSRSAVSRMRAESARIGSLAFLQEQIGLMAA